MALGIGPYFGPKLGRKGTLYMFHLTTCMSKLDLHISIRILLPCETTFDQVGHIVAQTRPKKSSPSELLWSLSVNKQCYIPNCSLACLVSETL